MTKIINYEFITNESRLLEIAEELKFQSLIQLDIETTGLSFKHNRILLVQIGIEGKQFLIEGKVSLLPLKEILQNPEHTKILHNALFDIPFILEHHGLEIHGVHDTMLAEKVIRGVHPKTKYSLAATLKRYDLATIDKEQQTSFIGMAPDAPFTEEQLEYAAKDVLYLEDLYMKQMFEANSNSQKIIALENKVLEATVAMRTNGITFNSDQWLKVANQTAKEYETFIAGLPTGINWRSNKQVKEYFDREHGITIGSYSELPDLVGKNKTLDLFIQANKLSKKVTAYGKKWLQVKLNNRVPIQTVDTVVDGKVYPNFNQIVSTGRYSSKQPNMQQIPRIGGYRECFKASKGYKLVAADYSGQELAIAAVMSNEKVWLNLIAKGGDIHGNTAAKIFGTAYTKEQRNTSKAVTFGILYGSGAFTISKAIGVSQTKAAEYIMRFKQSLPRLSQWLQNQGKISEQRMFTTTLYGRWRTLRGSNESAYTRGINTPIQGTGADIVKLALVKVQEYIHQTKYPAKLLLTVHDEIITEVPNSLTNQWALILKEMMEQASEEVLKTDIIKAEPEIMDFWTKQ